MPGRSLSATIVTYRSDPRLLARALRSLAEAARIASTRSATLSTTCSQLSNTNSRDRPSKADATDSLTLLPGC